MPHFVSLFDDSTDVWGVEDFKLLSPLSDVARWSRPDEFGRLPGADLIPPASLTGGMRA